MMRALYSGVSGLKTHQTKMDVIGNNIANVNTYGYKAQRVTFKDSFYQTLGNAHDATATSGGGNAAQVGYGSVIGTIDVLHTRGGYASTGNAMDVFIEGDGYLVARDANGQEMYTRVGVLGFDGAGNLVDGNSNYIYGYPMARYQNDVAETAGQLQVSGDLSVDFGASNNSYFNGYSINTVEDLTATGPSAVIDIAAKTITVTSNTDLSAADLQTALQNMTEANGATIPAAVDFSQITATGADTLALNVMVGDKVSGGDVSHQAGELIMQTIPATGATITVNDMLINFGDDNGSYFNGNKIKTVYDNTATATTAEIDLGSGMITITSPSTSVSAADIQTALQNMTAVAGTGTIPADIDLGAISVDGSVAPFLATGITSTSAIDGQDVSQTTVIDNANGLQQIKKSGSLIDTNNDGVYDAEANNVMELTGISISDNGMITGEDENGNIIQIGQIVLADIPNPSALTLDGNNYLTAEGNTGNINYYAPGEGTVGTLVSGGLENSNVDLATEFADMIITQRGFQANSRIITVGDEMLQELVNLKR